MWGRDGIPEHLVGGDEAPVYNSDERRNSDLVPYA